MTGDTLFAAATAASSTGCKTLALTDLPPFDCKGRKNPLPAIKRYLKKLVTRYTTPVRRCLILPSLDALSRHMAVSPQEVQRALRELKQAGYDSMPGGLYGHVTLWDKAVRSGGKATCQSYPPEWWEWLAWGRKTPSNRLMG